MSERNTSLETFKQIKITFVMKINCLDRFVKCNFKSDIVLPHPSGILANDKIVNDGSCLVFLELRVIFTVIVFFF